MEARRNLSRLTLPIPPGQAFYLSPPSSSAPGDPKGTPGPRAFFCNSLEYYERQDTNKAL